MAPDRRRVAVRLLDQRGISRRHAAVAEPKIVLESHATMPAEHRGGQRDGAFLGAERAHGPVPVARRGREERREIERVRGLVRTVAAEHVENETRRIRHDAALAQLGKAAHLVGGVEHELRRHALSRHPGEECGGFALGRRTGNDLADRYRAGLGPCLAHHRHLIAGQINADRLGGDLHDEVVAGLAPDRGRCRAEGLGVEQMLPGLVTDMEMDQRGARGVAGGGVARDLVRGQRQCRMIRLRLARAVRRHGKNERRPILDHAAALPARGASPSFAANTRAARGNITP